MSLKFNLKKGFNINLDGSAIEELGSDFKTNSLNFLKAPIEKLVENIEKFSGIKKTL